jgi:lysophospholipase L1-like esterase
MKILGVLRKVALVSVPTLVLSVLLLEGVFRWVIPGANTPDSYFDTVEGILRFDTRTNTEGTYTVGPLARTRHRWRVNDAGWNSPRDYHARKMLQDGPTRIAVFGDSYVEALHVDVQDSFPYVMERTLGDGVEVYSFGVSGAPLSEYLNQVRYAVRLFDPDVLLITVVHNDFDESLHAYRIEDCFLTLSPQEGKMVEVPPVPYTPGFSRVLKRSGLVRWLEINVHARETLRRALRGGEDREVNANVYVQRLRGRAAEVEAATDYVVGRIREENPSRWIVFVLDGPRRDIYLDDAENSSVAFLKDILAEACHRHGVDMVDLAVPFAADWAANARAFNSAEDFHWNAYGHRVVGKVLAAYLSPRVPSPGAAAGPREHR